MGMMDVIRAGLRERDDPIGLGVTDLAPTETDFKFPQVDLTQNHFRRSDHDFLF
jgi:hypothetical protein